MLHSDIIKNRKLVVQRIRQLQEDISQFFNDDELVNNRSWQLLLDHFFTKKTGRPSQKWIIKTQQLVKDISPQVYKDYISGFLQKLIDLLVLIHNKKTGSEVYFLLEEFQELYKGIIWSIGHAEDTNTLLRKVEKIALLTFKKIPTHGAISVRLGNACVYCFYALKNTLGIHHLLVLKTKVVYPSVRKRITRFLEEIAEYMDISADEIIEMSVADFNLSSNYDFEVLFGDYRVVVELDEREGVKVLWYNKERLIKTVPNIVKRECSEEYLSFRRYVKDLKQAVSIQKKRIESIFLLRRRWLFKEWKQYYFEHNLVSFFTKKLLWLFRDGDKQFIAFWEGTHWVTRSGQTLHEINEKIIVELWHPVFATVEDVLWWRNYFLDKQIKQPFKQVFREVYLLTDAEIRTRTYSNRFAAHILKQHQFSALCKVRNWEYKVKGYWEDKSIPIIHIPAWGMTAEFWVDVDWDGEMTKGNTFKLIFTDQVRFYDNDTLVELDSVPAVVFSEVMRDVDLFVGVTSIGNDPAWQDNNMRHNDYWHQYSFSQLTEAAKSRKMALERIIPRLGIANQCKIDGRFLIINGHLRAYKIHIGSGNILMSPNDQYLCIIPDAKQQSTNMVYLPFDGDRILSIIVSKALLLAKDTQIKDPVILAQILD